MPQHRRLCGVSILLTLKATYFLQHFKIAMYLLLFSKVANTWFLHQVFRHQFSFEIVVSCTQLHRLQLKPFYEQTVYQIRVYNVQITSWLVIAPSNQRREFSRQRPSKQEKMLGLKIVENCARVEWRILFLSLQITCDRLLQNQLTTKILTH